MSTIVVHKFGHNSDIDIASAEDIWDGGGDYPWPSAAAETSIASSSANDTAAGTGARTVRVYGLDSNYLQIQEDVTLNGTTNVVLTNQYLRVFRAKTLTAGTVQTNDGDIQVKHASTVLAQITSGYGQTLMAVYTVPVDYLAHLQEWYITFGKSKSAYGTMSIDVRPFGGAWQTKGLISVSEASANFIRAYRKPLVIEAKSDIRMRARNVSANDCEVSGAFDLDMEYWPAG